MFERFIIWLLKPVGEFLVELEDKYSAEIDCREMTTEEILAA